MRGTIVALISELGVPEEAHNPELKRDLGLGLLTLYGLGTTIGAGIYVLIGEIANISGLFAPVAFLLATVLAGFSALSFSEFSVRLPFSAGEAAYVTAGFNVKGLATVVGLMVVASGAVSAGAIVNGFVGYFATFVDLPPALSILLVTALLCTIACWGIVESVTIAAIITLVEIAGLVFIIAVAWPEFMTALPLLPDIIRATNTDFSVVWIGAALAFYALIGFEDMVNVAEEVRDVPRTMPRAIILTLIITGILYFIVALVAVTVMPLGQLATSDAPLAELYQHTTGQAPYVISLIGIVAVLNGALIQIIMGARIIYGLSHRGRLPALWCVINPKTRTPIRATLLVSAIVLTLALLLPLLTLAQFTSVITLTIFTLVNVALVAVKRRDKASGAPRPAFAVPLWVPTVGAIVSLGFVVVQVTELVG